MHIRSVSLKNFTSHRDTQFNLPDSGLVVITGGNGAGKSSLAEAIAWGLWGKTLRGTDPVSPGESCTSEVKTDSVVARRIKKAGGRASFSWEPVSGEAQKFENNTKAKEQLECVIGDLSVWRKTSVFSSHDAAHFTLASDGERKRLLETLLGIDRFDTALKSCREDLRSKQGELSTCQNDQRILLSRADGLLRRKADAAESLKANSGLAAGDPVGISAVISELTATVQSYDLDSRGVSADLVLVDDEIVRLDSELLVCSRKEKLFDSGYCPTCERKITPETDDWSKNSYHAVGKDLKSQREHLARRRRLLQEEIAHINKDRMSAVAELAKLRANLRVAETLVPERKRLQQTLTDATRDAKECIAESARIKKKIDLITYEITKLELCAKVLGLKGVRASVIVSALSGLESAANAWLARIADSGIHLEVKPYSQTTKGVTDSISLDIVGAGGGFGYKAASGGERRRVDIAVLLALAEISAAASGSAPGTMFFDEVFDALDEDGIEAVVSALSDLSADRAVVVITHSQELAKTLASAACAKRWHISSGVASRI